MNLTPTDSGQLLILAMVIFGGYALARAAAIKAKRKREEGGPCN
ncbi:conserved exported protein of unknown function [Pseudomonas sp. JV551A1]|uniref:Uncharacterized protein n=1 Tax=Pseudomonas inefficax TaxID=2078786 RepID=A0AAQ1PDD6_9PSED|nr:MULTISPECIES: hypothetical protein [Pseudomonas]SPO56207.1 conserved exported protein of unknown function [Pseudomonas sp. JV551A1]SPO62303.1 conserved exported protein of unknown function [Pseudomonas inefficax]